MKLSVQCYTLRDEFAKDAWATFRALAVMGFEYVELAGYYGLTPFDLMRGFRDLGLRVNASHVGLDRLENDLDTVIEENKLLENRYVVLPWIGAADYADGWAAFAKRVEPIGRKLKDAGLEFAYHNHSFEFKPEDGRPGLDVFYEAADPSLVLAQIDVAWVHHGGSDPAAYIRNLKGRVPLVHLKDITDNPDGLDIEAGKGVIDWDQVLAACREAGVEFGTIELDHCPNPPLESVRMSLEFFQSKGLS